MERLLNGQTFLQFLGGCFALYSLLIFYRLFLHPLASFPGPKRAACSRLYEAFWELLVWPGGQYTNQIKAMHAKYGPIVRINPQEISIDDPEFHEILYAPQPDVRDKIPMIANILGTTAGTFGTMDHYIHRKRRGASSLFFSLQNVSKTHALIQSHVDRLCHVMRVDVGVVLQARSKFLALKLDIFFDFAFGSDLGLQNDTQTAFEWDQTMEAISTCAPYVKLLPWILPIAVKLPIGFVNSFSSPLARVLRINRRIHKQALDFLHHYSKTSQRDSVQPEGLFEALMRSSLPASEKSPWRISQEGSEMFAASGTTARVMTTCIYHLHTRADALSRLRAELDMAIPDPHVIPSSKTLECLPYLAAVIRESLRLASPVATRLPLVAHRPLTYKEWIIPVGTPISVNGRDLMHNPSIYPLPDSFLPERWLTTGDTISDRYFVPFNKGTRMCLGKEFAMAELQITVATLIRRFEFELVDTDYSRDVQVIRDCFLTETRPGSHGVKIKVNKVRD